LIAWIIVKVKIGIFSSQSTSTGWVLNQKQRTPAYWYWRAVLPCV